MKKLIITTIALLTIASLHAREISNLNGKRTINSKNKNNTQQRLVSMATSCEAASQNADLDINNVRTKIQNGGDMWWDLLSNPKYEIPKVIDATSIRKHSLFAGALWIGGKSASTGNLKIAAMTYRQTGSDFFPGPLDISNASTEADRCNNYDKIWKITRTDLEKAEKSNWTDVSNDILTWPAGRNRAQKIGNETNSLAPFYDAGTGGSPDGNYDVQNGDYPILDRTNGAGFEGISSQPDMFLWYVYNDKGNIHSETGGIPIGLELQTTSFAYSTNDAVNDMTFYTTKIINRGNEDLEEVYFGQWVDPDLGNPFDDYVGCDVSKNLGFCYNGDDNDEGIKGYGTNPPTIGVDFFEGPKDENGTELGLSAFVYYDNSGDPVNGNPRGANDFYNYLRSHWRTGAYITYDFKNGKTGSDTGKFMFPGKTDPKGRGEWTEKSAGNIASDRRFIQSSGPFTLKPGAVNRVTVACIWAKTNFGGSDGSLKLLGLASDRAQKLFENNFKLVDGPSAPDVEIVELDQKIAFKFLNTDEIERYSEPVKDENGQISYYNFQGYEVYQLKNPRVSVTDLDNVDNARLVFQCDKKDNVSRLINQVFEPTIEDYNKKEMISGSNEGIVHSFVLTEDQFSSGSNKTFVNYKKYYFLVKSYSNAAESSTSTSAKLNTREQYLAGRLNIQTYTAIPYNLEAAGGLKSPSSYGDGPEITRLEGKGNSGNILEFTQGTIDEIISKGFAAKPTYKAGFGPVKLKVVDPLKVPKADFKLTFIEDKASTAYPDYMSKGTRWKLENLTTGDIVYSDTNFNLRWETVQGKDALVNGKPITDDAISLADWGLSITTETVDNPGENMDNHKLDNGLLSWEVIWSDPSSQWLTAVFDNDGASTGNWIRSGNVYNTNATTHFYTNDAPFPAADNTTKSWTDPYGAYEKIWNGRIAPYAVCSRQGYDASGRNTHGMANQISAGANTPLQELNSINLVITPDKTKWTKCLVFETGETINAPQNEGNANKFDLRKGTSKDVNGKNVSGVGTSYFPGYAINLETGERMNIAFGEDSRSIKDNGRDMLWNPTSTTFADASGYPVNGGRHYIYVFGNGKTMANRNAPGYSYNEFDAWKKSFEATRTLDIRKIWSQAMWVVPTYLASGHSMNGDNGNIPPSEVTFKLRVRRALTKYDKGPKTENGGLPMYTFSTDSIRPISTSESKEKAINMAKLVPNPYYGFSRYETSKVDNRVRITNLPYNCKIKIFTISGLLIKTIEKNDNKNWIDWDLRNNVGVPISSGPYIVHIDGGEEGTKILKWYGIMRTIDLDSF